LFLRRAKALRAFCAKPPRLAAFVRLMGLSATRKQTGNRKAHIGFSPAIVW